MPDSSDWIHHGVLIGVDNGIDTDGAWVPSVYATDSLATEVFLYCHNNHTDGRIFRTTLFGRGLGYNPDSTMAVTLPGSLRASPDVSRSPDGTCRIREAYRMDPPEPGRGLGHFCHGADTQDLGRCRHVRSC